MLPFALGITLALLVGTTLFFVAPAQLGPLERPFFETGSSETPVLVIVVGTASRVQVVHDAIDHSALVVAERRGFALAGRRGTPRRIVAADYDAVGPILAGAGWVDAELEIATPPRRERARTAKRPKAKAEGEGEGEGELNLASLAAQPTLSLAEALALLNSDAL